VAGDLTFTCITLEGGRERICTVKAMLMMGGLTEEYCQ
jgi:hypothetical protein